MNYTISDDDGYHEVCSCEDCHKAGEHENPYDWYQTKKVLVYTKYLVQEGCDLCERMINLSCESPRGDDYDSIDNES